MTTIESDQKAQPLRAAIQSSIGAKPQISSKTSKSIRREKNTDRDKENTTNSNVNAGNDETQKSTPTSTSDKRKHLLPRSPFDSKVALFSLGGAGSPSYKVVRRFEDKVKVGFVVANGPSVGMHVVKVIPGLPADKAGLEVGDVIHVISGHQTLKVEDFRLIAANWRPGDVVPIKITREVVPTKITRGGENSRPKQINLVMRLPHLSKEDNIISPQKAVARQVKLELARMKEEKEKAEREALEKVKKDKQKQLEEKKSQRPTYAGRT